MCFCPDLPKPLGIFAQLCRAWLPKALGMDAHRFGHSYPRTWSWLPMYVGTSNHVRGHNGCISFDISLVLYAVLLVLYAVCRFFMILLPIL